MACWTELLVLAMSMGLAKCLQCYSCTSALPAETDATAKMALKYLIRNNYNLPDIHDRCSDALDIMFKTVPYQGCDSRCTTITAKHQDVQLTLRGCESDLFLANTSVQEQPCNGESSPSICYCQSQLCNKASTLRSNTFIFTIVLYLVCFFILMISS